MTTVLIPAYEPDDILIDYVYQLKKSGFRVVVADDGSGQEYDSIFNQIESVSEVIRFPRNRGKGAVLKSLYDYCEQNRNGSDYFITADSDGQHLLEDVQKVNLALEQGNGFVIGMRSFTGKVPAKSLLGNGLSRFVFAIAASTWLKDNQTGLRGFSFSQLSWMQKVPGEKYDYELCVLWYASMMGIPIYAVPIQTVYLNNNAKTHFRALEDTVSLYTNLLLTDKTSVVIRILILSLLILYDIGLLGSFSGVLATTIGWVCLNALVLLFRKMTIFKGLPVAGAPKDMLFSLVSFIPGLLLVLLFPGFPVSVLWISGRILALPGRYFLCEALSKAAVSSEESAEISFPK